MILRSIFSLALWLVATSVFAQDCNTLNLAFPDIQLEASLNTGTANRSGVAFHPVFQVYYSVNAGSTTYPIDAYDADGNILVSPASGFDYRGLWFNPVTTFIEGNGFNDQGVASHNLAPGTGNPTGSITALLPVAQPSDQSCGDIDPENNYLIYYFNGEIYRYNRTDNSSVDVLTITGLPSELAEINTTGIVYVGCPGKEYAIYNYVDKQLLYINQSNGEYAGFTQLPVSAPGVDRFNMSFANNRLFLYNRNENRWESYFVTDVINSQVEIDYLEAEVSYGPNPFSDQLTVSIQTTTVGQYRLEVYNVFGQAIGQWVVTDRTTIPLGHLKAGTYLARVVDAERGKFSKVSTVIKN